MPKKCFFNKHLKCNQNRRLRRANVGKRKARLQYLLKRHFDRFDAWWLGQFKKGMRVRWTTNNRRIIEEKKCAEEKGKFYIYATVEKIEKMEGVNIGIISLDIDEIYRLKGTNYENSFMLSSGLEIVKTPFQIDENASRENLKSL